MSTPPKHTFPGVRPMPGIAQQQETTHGIGHNRYDPTNEAVREFDERIDQREGFRARIEQLLAASERAVCVDPDTAGKCTDLAKQIAAAGRVIEDARKGVKEPYLQAGKAIDNAARVLSNLTTKADQNVRVKLNDFVREERERERAEARRVAEAQRAEDEARRAEAPDDAPPPPSRPAPLPEAPVQVRGDYGALATAKTVWRPVVTDYTLAFIAVENNENVRAAIDKAIAALVRSGVHKIDGVTITEDAQVSVR